MNLYQKWNKRMRPILWWIVIAGLIAALPLAYVRDRTESSANNVEFVFDYRDLLDIADTQPNPLVFVDEQLQLMKKAGITTMSVYESTLQEMKEARRIEVFSSHDVIALENKLTPRTENFTYVLFADRPTQDKLEPIIRAAFEGDLKVPVKPWSYGDRTGLVIELGVDDALLRPMDPDPMNMQYLKDQGFHLTARLSNKRPFNSDKMDALLAQLKTFGIDRIIPDSDAVPGFTKDPNDIKRMADKMRKYKIGLAAIELLKEPQKGFNELANSIGYNVVRLHSFTEKDTEKFLPPMLPGDLQALEQEAADRFVLAVKDRNIRMVFLNAKVSKNPDKKMVDHPLNAIYESLNGPDGAVPRIQKSGFALAPAQAFQADFSSGFTKAVQTVAPFLLLLGGVALIALTISYFVPEVTLIVYILGLVGAAGLRVAASHYYSLLMALAVAVCAATLAMIVSIRYVKRASHSEKRLPAFFIAFWVLVRATVVSLIGVAFVVALLNQMIYFLVLDQFRGVSLLHLVPILLAGIYLVLFSDDMTYAQRWERLKKIMTSKISVLWLVLAGVGIGVIFYYLTRTGNEGQASGLERTFRSFLENTMGVRPRTKEFLLSHPFFILGAYLAVKYKNAVYLMLLGVIGQLSIVDTFAHLHTPLEISGLRVLYGLIIGAIIGLALIAAWEIVTRSWKQWGAPRLKR